MSSIFSVTMTTWPNQDAAANRRPAGQSDGSDNLSATLAAVEDGQTKTQNGGQTVLGNSGDRDARARGRFQRVVNACP